MLKDNVEPDRQRAWRAGLATVLATAMATGTFSQFVFSVLAPFLREEFAISRLQLGLLTTATFAVGAIVSLPVGRLVDRFGGRRTIVASMSIVSVSMLIMALAPTYGMLLLGATIGGAALASGNPVTNKLIAVHLPPGERGLIMGVKQAGVQVGAFAIGALLPSLATAWGWRAALAPVMVVPVIGVGAALKIVPPDAGPSRETDLGQVLGGFTPVVRRISIYGFLMGLGVASVSSYLPLYAHDEVGMSIRLAGFVAALVGLVGILSRVFWGHLSERYGRYWLPLVVMGVGSAAATVMILAAASLGPALLWIAAVVFGATAITWNTVGMLYLLSEVEIAEAGRASGWVLLGFYGGFAASPALFGHSVDATGGYGLGWTAATVVFVISAVVAELGRRSRRRTRGAR